MKHEKKITSILKNYDHYTVEDFKGIALVIFNKEDMALKVLNHFNKFSFEKALTKGKNFFKRIVIQNDSQLTKLEEFSHNLEVSVPPEPSDIIWDHLVESESTKRIRNFLVWILLILICSVTLYMIFRLDSYNEKLRSGNKYKKFSEEFSEMEISTMKQYIQVYLITILMSLTITIINAIVQLIMQLLSS